DAALNALTRSVPAVSRERRGQKPLLNDTEAAAEKEFVALCREYAPDVVGVWDGRPVHYPPFAQPPAFVSRDLFERLGWGHDNDLARVNADLSMTKGRTDLLRHQQLGYAGWLRACPDYPERSLKYRGFEGNPDRLLRSTTRSRPKKPISRPCTRVWRCPRP